MEADGQDKIQTYVADMRERGFADDAIRQQLLRFGWSVYLVDQVIGGGVPLPQSTVSAMSYNAKPKGILRILSFVFGTALFVAIIAGLVFMFGRLNKHPTPTVTKTNTVAQPQNSTGDIVFEPLETTNFGDIAFTKPKDWAATETNQNGLQTYRSASPSADKPAATLTIAAGYDALGSDFANQPADQQAALLEQVKSNLDPNSILDVEPDKDCQNRQFSPFAPISYSNTVLALQSTGTCTINNIEKRLVINALVFSSGETALITVSAEKTTFGDNKVSIETIINSIRPQ